MGRRFAVALSVGGVLLADACHEGRPHQVLEDELVERICTARARCACGPELTTCRTEVRERVEDAFDEAVAADLGVDAECIDEALSTLEGLGCRTLDGLTIDERGRAYDRLLCHAFHGVRGEGERCSALELSDNSECDQGLDCSADGRCIPQKTWPAAGEVCEVPLTDCTGETTCLTDPTTQSASCQTLPLEGDPCAGVETACAPGLVCSSDGGCEPAPTEGEACSTSVPTANRCAVDLVCIEDVCRIRGGTGNPCTPEDCEVGLYCDGSRNRCAERPPIACGFADAL